MSNESEHLTPDEEKTQQPEPVEAASPLAEASQQTPETAGNLSSDEAETPAEESSGRADSSARAEEAVTEPLPDDAFLTALFSGQPVHAEQPEAEAAPRFPDWIMRLGKALRHDRRLRAFLAASALIVCIVCLVIFGGVRLAGQAVRLVRYSGDETRFSFDAHNSNSYASFHNGLAIASVSGLMSFSKDGAETALMQNQMDLPVLLENDTVAMSYGVGGSSICTVHYKKDAHMQIPVPGTLLDADLSDDSCMAYSSVQPGYKTVLTVLDDTGTEIYSWYSSTRFFSQCAVSKDAEALAATALGQSGSSFDTSCVLFATDHEQPVAELSLGDDLVYELSFVDDDRLCAVGETALHFFRADGGSYTQYPYDGGELLHYDLKSDQFAAIVRDMNQAGSRYSITTVSHDGKELASLPIDSEILDISANGHYLAVLTADRLRVYDSRLRVCLSEDNVGFATQVCVQKDGAALLIDGSSAHRVS